MKKTNVKNWLLLFSCLLAVGLFLGNDKIAGAESNEKDFVIHGNTLMAYQGEGGEVTIPDGVDAIWERAFYGKTITKVVLPNSVKDIHRYAFGNCTQLKEVALNVGLKNIGDNAFYDCGELTEVTIPGTITNIGLHAFRGCTNLMKINVEAGSPIYSSVDGVLFAYGNLIVAYPGGKKGDYTVPDNVSAINGYAFAECKGLTGITIPNKIRFLEAGSFLNCENLTNVTFLDGVTGIGQSAFEGCVRLTNVQLPNTLKDIHPQAFKGCTELRELHLKSRLSWIGEGAFSGCTNLSTFTVDKANTNFSARDGVLYNKKQTELRLYPIGKTGDVKFLPSVKSIGLNAFQGCTNLTVIKIPKHITTVGTGAFRDCVNLNKVELPETLTTLYSHVFKNCIGLSTVEIPGYVKTIYREAFGGCENITKITIPESVKLIQNGAFADCHKLVLYGDKNSYAQKYAKIYSFGFIETVTKPARLQLTVTSSKKKIAKLSWKKVEKATGYVIQMSKKKSGFKTIAKVKKGKKTILSKGGLKSGKTYYFRARAYKTVNQKTYYGNHSEIIGVRIK